MSTFRILLRAVCLALTCGLAASPSIGQATESPPLSAYGALPQVEDMALSSSGKRIAALTTIRGVRLLTILDDALVQLRAMEVGDVKVRSIEWIDDDRMLVQMSQTEDLGEGFTADQYEFWRAVVVSVDPSVAPWFVFGDDRRVADAVFGTYGLRRAGAGATAYFGGIMLDRTSGYWVAPHYRPALFAVNLSRDENVRIAPAGSDGHKVDWLVGADGIVAATFDIDTHGGKWTIAGPRGQMLAQGVATNGDAGLLALGPHGDTAIFSQDDDGGTARWFEVPLDGGAAPQEFLPDQNVDRLFVDRIDGRLLGYLA